MLTRMSESRMTWLAAGLLAGMALSYFWPHEPAKAITTDRNDKFAMATIPVSLVSDVEGIFLLDFSTGQLRGAVLNNKIGKFTHSYQRNIAADFKVDPTAGSFHYSIVAGRANLPSQGPATLSTGVLYVGELTSGRVICYAFPYNESNRPTQAVLRPIDSFQFREPLR